MFAIRICAVALIGVLSITPVLAGSDQPGRDEVLVEIGDERVTVEEFLAYLEMLRPHFDIASAPEATRRRELDEYLERRLLAIHARKLGLDKAAEPRRQIEFFTDGILAEALRKQTVASIGVSAREIRTYYDEHRDEFRVSPRLLLEHLIYARQSSATRARDSIHGGTPYAELVDQNNRDPNLVYSRRGWMTPDLLIAEIAEPVQALKPGEVTEVLQSTYGFHVVRVVELEPAYYRPIEDVQQQIVEKVQRQNAAAKHDKMLGRIRDEVGVRVNLDALPTPGAVSEE